jgi:hypothetical protein
MEYLHMQKPCPAEVKGVPVKLTAVAPDGSVINIGTAVTDGPSGVFALAWTPPAEGTYKVTASFEGDDSYGPSYAVTYLLVGPAPSASPLPSATAVPSPSAPVSPSVSPSVAPPAVSAPGIDMFMVAAAVVVVVVIVAAVVILKKRK